MSDSFDTRVSVSLHPANLTKMDGYDDDTRSFLAPEFMMRVRQQVETQLGTMSNG